MRTITKAFIAALLALPMLLCCNSASAQKQLSSEFKDIKGITTSDQSVSLSSFFDGKNYVLIDFWASWCGPCREETPNVIKVYNQYKDKGLRVVGIAVSDKKDDTIKAIRELGIPYPQILEAEKAGINGYGVKYIPSIFLLSPDGKIIAKDLREEEIGAAVAKALNK